jgi:hypothetical protein
MGKHGNRDEFGMDGVLLIVYGNGSDNWRLRGAELDRWIASGIEKNLKQGAC